MIPGILLAHVSLVPAARGLLLVGGYEVPPVIRQADRDRAAQAADRVHRPRHLHDRAEAVPSEGTMTSSPRKVEIGRRVFSEHVDARRIRRDRRGPVQDPHAADVRVPAERDGPQQQAADRPLESGDDRILEAASIVLRRGTAEITLLGNPTEVEGARRNSASRWRAPRSST